MKPTRIKKKTTAKEGRPLLSCVKGLRSPTIAHQKQVKDLRYYMGWLEAVASDLVGKFKELEEKNYWNEEDLAAIKKADEMTLIFRAHVMKAIKEDEAKKQNKKEKK
jgi:hypothetical protein